MPRTWMQFVSLVWSGTYIHLSMAQTTSTLSNDEGEDVTLPCSLSGTFTFPEWEGPPFLTIYTIQDDPSGTINPAAPAASRLTYASNNRDLILSKTVILDSGDYRCRYTGLGDHTITLAVIPATTQARCQVQLTHNSASASADTFICGENTKFTCKIDSAPVLMSWVKDGSSLTNCQGATDSCFDASKDNYQFTSDVAVNEFYLTVNSVIFRNAGTFTCSDGAFVDDSKTISIAAVPSAITMTQESGTRTITLEATTDCAFPMSDVSVEWYYLKELTDTPQLYTDYGFSPVRTEDSSTCTSGDCTSGVGVSKVVSTVTFDEKGSGGTSAYLQAKMVHSAASSSSPAVVATTTNKYIIIEASTDGCCCCLIDCKDIEIGGCYFANIMIYIIIFVNFSIIVGIVVEAIFNIWEKMSLTWRILSFFVFLFGLGLFIKYAGTKKKVYSLVIGSCLVSSTGTGTGLYYKLLKDEQKEGNITPLSKSSGDTITIGCLLPGTFTCPEWRGPPSFTPFTNFNDCTINPEVPAASRLLYDTDNRSLILSNAQTYDSGDYKCAYTKKGDHTIRLTVNPATNNASTYGTTTTSASTYDTTTTSAPTYGTTQKPSSGEKLPVCLMGCIFSTVIAVIARFGLIG